MAEGLISHPLQPITACNTSPLSSTKMADRVTKYLKPYDIGPYKKLLLNKFFDSIIPSITTFKIKKRLPGGLKMADGVWKMVNP